MTPTRHYLVCATPRSGSTLLCEALRSTGVAGRPEECFQGLAGSGRPRPAPGYLDGYEDAGARAILTELAPVGEEPSQAAQAGCPSYPAYLALVRERGTTPNGVWGAKLMWSYVDGLLWHLREQLGLEGEGADLLENGFPGLRYVHVRRDDRARQAISLWMALQTWSWRSEDARRDDPEPVFHAGAIEFLARTLAADDAAWDAFFAAWGIEPLRVRYEELAGDLEGTVRTTLAGLGLELPAGVVLAEEEPLTRQAGARTEAWVRRLRAGRGALSYG